MEDIVGARAIARDAVVARIASAALELFDTHGFSTVTMDDVARAAGVSVRTVHRYFASKEDLVIGDPAPTAVKVERAFRSVGPERGIWEALRDSFEPLVQQAGSNAVDGRRVLRVVATTASLRARNLEKQIVWSDRLVPLVAERIGDFVDTSSAADPDAGASAAPGAHPHEPADLEARADTSSGADGAGRPGLEAAAIVHMALACFDVAFTAWARDEHAEAGVLLDEAFAGADRLGAGGQPPRKGRAHT